MADKSVNNSFSSSKVMARNDQLWIFVYGAHMSSLGKGIIASSIGYIFEACGMAVTFIKTDPYFCLNAGRLAPSEYGETYITHDGLEADADLGSYERLCAVRMCEHNAVTTGRIMKEVIADENEGRYDGTAVKLIPHISGAMRRRLESIADIPVTHCCCKDHPVCLGTCKPRRPQVVIVEIGGALGEFETVGWIAAAREIRASAPGRCVSCLVSIVPEAANEQIVRLATLGIEQAVAADLPPDVVICRTGRPLKSVAKRHIAAAAGIEPSSVISDADSPCAPTAVPFQFVSQNLLQVILRKVTDSRVPVADLNRFSAALELLRSSHIDLLRTEGILPTDLGGDALGLASLHSPLPQTPLPPPVKIVLCGKYVSGSNDIYRSVELGVRHAAQLLQQPVTIENIDAELIEEGDPVALAALKSANGIIVPGGFGTKGVEGKIATLMYAIENNVPSLGICLGFQCTVIASSRMNGMTDAHSTEFNPDTSAPVIKNLFTDTKVGETAAGHIRLGHHTFTPRTTTVGDRESRIASVYKALRGSHVGERHRHRFAVNPDLVDEIEAKTPLRFVFESRCAAAGGACTAPHCGQAGVPVMEVVEVAGTTYNVGIQAHPEMTTRPGAPGPAFVGLVHAAAGGKFTEEDLKIMKERADELDIWGRMCPACK